MIVRRCAQANARIAVRVKGLAIERKRRSMEPACPAIPTAKRIAPIAKRTCDRQRRSHIAPDVRLGGPVAGTL